jgi:hypothetical protein
MSSSRLFQPILGTTKTATVVIEDDSAKINSDLRAEITALEANSATVSSTRPPSSPAGVPTASTSADENSALLLELIF